VDLDRPACLGDSGNLAAAGEDPPGGAPGGMPRVEAAAAAAGRGLVARRLRARCLEPCAARWPRRLLMRARESLGTALPGDCPRPEAVERSRDKRRVAQEGLAGSDSLAGSRGSGGHGSGSEGRFASIAGLSIGSEMIRCEGPSRLTGLWSALRPSKASDSKVARRGPRSQARPRISAGRFRPAQRRACLVGRAVHPGAPGQMEGAPKGPFALKSRRTSLKAHRSPVREPAGHENVSRRSP
jgi:hypothetical protein